MSFPAYADYRDSGVPWLGEVPNHWKRKPLFALVQERNDSNAGMQEDNLLSLSYGQIKRKNIDDNDGLLPASFETYQIVERDDIIWRLTDLQNDQRSLRTGIVRERGIITSAYLATRPTAIEPEFLAYLLRAYDLTKVFYSMGGGLRQSMKFSDVKWLPVMLPSQTEQVAITAFLDRETAKIDALVAEQEQLIALLKEKRQAVISHAVTKGLNPNAPMKDSGIEWLGEIPAHWDVRALKHACSLLRDGTHQPPARVDDGVSLLSVRNIQDGRFSFREDDSQISEADYDELCRSFVPMGGDVLLAVVGATLGKSAIIPMDFGRFHIQRSVAIFRPNSATGPEWLNYLFASDGFQRLLWSNVGFSAQPGIYLGSLANFQIPIPPVDEQSKIVEGIAPALSSLEALLSEAQSAITLLQERRAALISAAVTGKIDVRGLVPQTAELETA